MRRSLSLKWVISSWSTSRSAAIACCEQRGAFKLYRGTSPMRKRLHLGPFIKAIPRALRWSYSEVNLKFGNLARPKRHRLLFTRGCLSFWPLSLYNDNLMYIIYIIKGFLEIPVQTNSLPTTMGNTVGTWEDFYESGNEKVASTRQKTSSSSRSRSAANGTEAAWI